MTWRTADRPDHRKLAAVTMYFYVHISIFQLHPGRTIKVSSKDTAFVCLYLNLLNLAETESGNFDYQLIAESFNGKWYWLLTECQPSNCELYKNSFCLLLFLQFSVGCFDPIYGMTFKLSTQFLPFLQLWLRNLEDKILGTCPGRNPVR